ncbi:hypothetical protein FSOLCH5_15545 [Fusarium solani]
MAALALVSGPGPIRIVPAGVANVHRLPGSDYGILGLDDTPLSTRLPYEIMQQIYLYLDPEDFNAARFTSRSWFRAGLCPSLLVEMLKRGGWWSSLQQISEPLRITRPRNILDQERLMSKWISRECDLASMKGSAFKQVGFTDFSGLVPGSTTARLHGTLVFTMSLCGRFLMVTHGRTIYVYELNHVCFSRRLSWSLPLRPREGRRLGMLRPAATVVCPRRVISCSMDTSSGRNAVAVLMEGRMGIVCDIMAETNAALTQTRLRRSEDDSFGSTPNLFSRMPAACVWKKVRDRYTEASVMPTTRHARSPSALTAAAWPLAAQAVLSFTRWMLSRTTTSADGSR